METSEFTQLAAAEIRKMNVDKDAGAEILFGFVDYLEENEALHKQDPAGYPPYTDPAAAWRDYWDSVGDMFEDESYWH